MASGISSEIQDISWLVAVVALSTDPGSRAENVFCDDPEIERPARPPHTAVRTRQDSRVENVGKPAAARGWWW